MWFRFPRGAERITIERQEFASEFSDADGWNYFRAPSHFAPRILHLGAGFAIVNDPKGMPEDLPREDPERDNAIASLTAQLAARDDEVAGLRSDLIAVRTELNAKLAEILNLRSDLAKANATIQDLKDDADILGSPIEPPPKAAPNGSKRT